MRYEWDPTKRASNLAKHGIEFEAADDFEWDTALIEADIRRDYGEERFRALGLIGNRVHVLIYTPRGNSRWIISLRKENLKEAVYYATRD